MDAQQTTIYQAVLITALVLGIIITYFIVSILRQQRRNIELYKSKILAEITTLENERKRVSSDLHDDLGPLLSSIKFKIDSIEISKPEDKLVMQQTIGHIDETIKRLREIANNLTPNTLRRKGIVLAVEEFIEKNSGPAELKISFQHNDIPPLKPEHAVNLYRIIQEITHNAIKHSKATELLIEMKCDDKMLLLQTKDNGVGFDQKRAATDNAGLGLRNLLSRTEVMHGDIFVESQPGRGVKYLFEIPLTEIIA